MKKYITSAINWDKVKRAWKKGNTSLTQIAKKHGVSVSGIRYRAKRHDWGNRGKKNSVSMKYSDGDYLDVYSEKSEDLATSDEGLSSLVIKEIENSEYEDLVDDSQVMKASRRRDALSIYAASRRAISLSMKRLGSDSHEDMGMRVRQIGDLMKIHHKVLLQILEYEGRLERLNESRGEQGQQFLNLQAAKSEILGRLARLRSALQL